MKFSYGFNPSKPYGVEILPSMENYDTSSPKHEDYSKKAIGKNFGLMELFVLVMLIPFWTFVYKFFYLLVLPLVPILVVTFEIVREFAPLNKLLMFGSSFLAAYLFYRVLKYFFNLLSSNKGILLFIILYIVATWSVYLLLNYYPQNEVLHSATVEINNFLTFVKCKI